jgi:hypothetical protein
LKGTLQVFPQSEQTASNISRGAPPPFLRVLRQSLQRVGSFVKPFSAKNSCSPAVKMNSCPQSLHVKVLSLNNGNTSFKNILLNQTDKALFFIILKKLNFVKYEFASLYGHS